MNLRPLHILIASILCMNLLVPELEHGTEKGIHTEHLPHLYFNENSSTYFEDTLFYQDEFGMNGPKKS